MGSLLSQASPASQAAPPSPQAAEARSSRRRSGGSDTLATQNTDPAPQAAAGEARQAPGQPAARLSATDTRAPAIPESPAKRPARDVQCDETPAKRPRAALEGIQLQRRAARCAEQTRRALARAVEAPAGGSTPGKVGIAVASTEMEPEVFALLYEFVGLALPAEGPDESRLRLSPGNAADLARLGIALPAGAQPVLPAHVRYSAARRRLDLEVPFRPL